MKLLAEPAWTRPEPELVWDHASSLFLLSPAHVVGRISRDAEDQDRAQISLTLTRWLVEQQFPVTAPVEVDQPVRIGEAMVTSWRYYPQHGECSVLGDWDEVGTGPRELDLINTHQGARFGRTTAERRQFTQAYGYDVTTWSGFPVLREMRDLHTLVSYIRLADDGDEHDYEQLTLRLSTLKAGDHAALWAGNAGCARRPPPGP